MAGAAQEDEDAITGINVTPLVDITLVLLIIFMMTASYIVTPAIKVELPKAATATSTVQTTLSLVLTKDNELYLNNAKTTDADLRAFIRSELAKKKELEAVIAADAAVQHGRVVGLIDLIRSEGVLKFALNTDTGVPSEVSNGKESAGPAGSAPGAEEPKPSSP